MCGLAPVWKHGSTSTACREGHWGLGVGHARRSARARNMSYMIVTLDVSRLSCWLNAFALCQAEREAYIVVRRGARYWPRGEKAWWDRTVEACWEGHRMRWGRACTERTENMTPMLVTLDVLKLSSWLKASAPCAESKSGERGRHVG